MAPIVSKRSYRALSSPLSMFFSETHFLFCSCSSYCVEQGRCAMGRCYCLPSARSDMRCYESGIPGWTCPLESYNDGKECHYSCGIDDPDCRGIKLSDCDAKYQSTKIIPIENLASWCPVGMSKLSSPVDVPSPPTPPPPPQLSTTTSGTSSKSAEPLPLIEGRVRFSYIFFSRV